MENLLYEKFQKLNLFKENEDTENGYNLSLEQALKKTLNNIYNNISVDDKSSDYNIFVKIYEILSSNKVMNIVAKILIFFIIILFGLSVYGIIYFIFFLVKTII